MKLSTDIKWIAEKIPINDNVICYVFQDLPYNE